MKPKGTNLPLNDNEQKPGRQKSSLSVSRRFFIRSAGVATLGLALPWEGLTKSSALGELNYFAKNQKHYYAHDAVLDQFGVIAPWYKEPNGQVDNRVRIAAETLKRYPWTTSQTAIAVYPHYMFNSQWAIDKDGKITPVDSDDLINGDLGQRSANVLKGMVEYYRYSGDPAAIAHMTYMGDFLVDHSLTPEDHHWPKFPISVPVKGKAYGDADPKGMIQLDICARMAEGLLRAYQVTGNERWFEAIKHWGDLFAEKCNLDPAKAPWARYANPEHISPKWKEKPLANVQTGGVCSILAFLDELIKVGYTGKNNNIIAARDAGLRYLNDTLLPLWTKDTSWALFFWDWLNQVQNCSTTADVGNYIMKNTTRFPNWKNDVRNILTLFFNRSSANPLSNGDVYSGAWAYPESSRCCGRSLWYAPLEVGGTLARYGSITGNEWAQELAYRQIILQTYDAKETGVTEDNIDGGVIVNGRWLNIAHPWPLLWGLTAISWLPERLGASRENHLVKSNVVVRNIEYGKGVIAYTTFNAPADTLTTFRLAFKPKRITTEGNEIYVRSNLELNGYTLKELSNGDYVVEIRHDGAKNVVLYGPDPQKVISNTDLVYTGLWEKQENTASVFGNLWYTKEKGASVAAEFRGNQVRLSARTDASGGLADVYIDGVKQLVSIDFYNTTTRDRQILYYKNGLGKGKHTIKVVAQGSGSYYSKGTAVYVDSLQYSSEDRISNFPSGTGPKGTQRMIFGFPKRQDYKDGNGNLWRPGTEIVSRLKDKDPDAVASCWWSDAVDQISGTSDPELYLYGYHAKELWVNITVGPAKYDLRLKFAATRGFDAAKNSFDVIVNGNVMVASFDVKATAGGLNKATDILFKNISPMNGIIEVRLKAGDQKNGEAFLQALEVGQNLKGISAVPKSYKII